MKTVIISIVTSLLSVCTMLGASRVVNIAAPRLTVYLPSEPEALRRAVLACPGGGYTHLATEREGQQWAQFFNDLGLTYAVLEYRMPAGDCTVPIADVQQAFKAMADSAAVWNIDPASIGIMGSSAGGHLAATIATNPKVEMPVKPAFQILFYPVISLDPAITHMGTHDNFLGAEASKQQADEWSSERFVTATTPPAFIVLSSDDKVVHPLNSINYYAAMCRNGVPASMHVYPTGGHGWGFRPDFKYHDLLLAELAAWLKK